MLHFDSCSFLLSFWVEFSFLILVFVLGRVFEFGCGFGDMLGVLGYEL